MVDIFVRLQRVDICIEIVSCYMSDDSFWSKYIICCSHVAHEYRPRLVLCQSSIEGKSTRGWCDVYIYSTNSHVEMHDVSFPGAHDVCLNGTRPVFDQQGQSGQKPHQTFPLETLPSSHRQTCLQSHISSNIWIHSLYNINYWSKFTLHQLYHNEGKHTYVSIYWDSKGTHFSISSVERTKQRAYPCRHRKCTVL